MPRTQHEIETDIAKEAALSTASRIRLDALQKELRELTNPSTTGEVEAAAAKAGVDAAIADYQKLAENPA